MAASAEQTLENIERRRVQLQESVDKLRRALSHWTTWEAEYAALKEELEGADDPSPDAMRDMARELEPTLLNDAEVEALLGANLATKRSANQVVDLIARRIDYVQQNSATVEKQLDTAEKQLAGVDVLLEPGVDNEEGLPMMDIEEELDEEGNAISTSLNQTGKGAAELVEVLRKAGEKNPQLAKLMGIKQEETTKDATSAGSAAQEKETPQVTKSEDTEATAPTPPTNSTEPAAAPKKSVSFAEEVDVQPLVDEQPSRKDKGTLETDGYNEDLADLNFTSGTKVIELGPDDEEIASYPIIPQGESPEDAELRRQMLQYGLSEVGRIVAELDLDTPVAEYSDDYDEDDDDYDDDEDEEDEDEDEYGRSTKPAVTEEYRKQMAELEKKLNARMLENVGPRPETDELEEQAEAVRTLKVQKDEEFDAALAGAKSTAPKSTEPKSTESRSTESPVGSKKKGVRFADDLDVSEAPKPAKPTPAAAPAPSARPAPTMSDIVVERPVQPAQPPQPPTAPKPGKVSRFKSARAAGEQPRQMLASPQVAEAPPMPTGPAGRTMANTIVEHAGATSESTLR